MRSFNMPWLSFITGKDDDMGTISYNIYAFFTLSYKNAAYVWMKGGAVNILFG